MEETCHGEDINPRDFLNKTDYYDILGLDRSDKITSKDVRKRFYKRSRQFHPDVNPDPLASECFKMCSKAYECLGDDNKRAHYHDNDLDLGDNVAMSQKYDDEYCYGDDYHDLDLLINLMKFENLFGWRRRESSSQCSCPDCCPHLYRTVYERDEYYYEPNKNNMKREYNSSNSRENFENFDLDGFLKDEEDELKKKGKKKKSPQRKGKKKKKKKKKRSPPRNKQKIGLKKNQNQTRPRDGRIGRSWARKQTNKNIGKENRKSRDEPDPFTLFSNL